MRDAAEHCAAVRDDFLLVRQKQFHAGGAIRCREQVGYDLCTRNHTQGKAVVLDDGLHHVEIDIVRPVRRQPLADALRELR